ncbi:MAG: hypothetical protein KGS72_17745 [Cyanobacteria bacterium REEB67]|nr:hypothetical protein [Cyanobacteria bacterium REEB67]
MIGLSDKSEQSEKTRGLVAAWQKYLLWSACTLMTLIVLALFSPSLSQPPLFDECYLLAWLSHCLQMGFFAGDTSAYLLAPAADMRDGLTPVGALAILLTAMVSGTNYSLMRFLQVADHLLNAALLFYIVQKVASRLITADRPNRAGNEHPERADNQTTPPLAIAVSLLAAFFFAIFPLAPEAVSWLYAWPIELATTCMLAASALLLTDKVKEQKAILIAAVVLGVLAPGLSPKAALLSLLPATLLIIKERGTLLKAVNKKGLRIAAAIIIGTGITTAACGLMQPLTVPETIKQLTVEKINLGQETAAAITFMENGAGANLQAIALPINRKIDERYKRALRRLYFLIALPLLCFVVALPFSPTMRALAGTALLVLACGSLLSSAAINAQTFYGARWLYPYLPAAGLLWALIVLSPMLIKGGTGKYMTLTLIRIILSAVFVICFSYFFLDRTYRQCMSYKSNGKLWKVITSTIAESGRKQTSPFLIVRNLPATLTIAPLLSPFSPELIDTQSGMPRTASLSAGYLKDALRNGKYTGLVVHYEKQYEGFLDTNIKPVDIAFGPTVDATQIAAKLTPPLMYYQGTITVDKKDNLLHLISQTKMGPALRMECYGLSPVDGDFLCVEAKIDLPAGQNTEQADQQLELHWLTNWLGDWEARDRKVTTSGPMADGQFHRYYFPLRTLAWTTSGLPTNLMLGFPRGATVDLRSISLCVANTGQNSAETALPHLSATAVHKQDANKNYFSHYCFNYPDREDLGLCAVYGGDNALDLKYDVAMIAGATGAVAEIVPLNEAFRNENSETMRAGSLRLEQSGTSGDIKVGSEQLDNRFKGAGLFSVRIYATRGGKPLGRASDSIKCLVDTRL